MWMSLAVIAVVGSVTGFVNVQAAHWHLEDNLGNTVDPDVHEVVDGPAGYHSHRPLDHHHDGKLLSYTDRAKVRVMVQPAKLSMKQSVMKCGRRRASLTTKTAHIVTTMELMPVHFSIDPVPFVAKGKRIRLGAPFLNRMD